jgi:actin-related protein 5
MSPFCDFSLQPSIIGVDQAGISETLEFVLKKYPPQLQDRLANNILLTGSLSGLSGFARRVERDVREFRPAGSSLRVTVARDPGLDAWKGAANWAKANAGEEEAAFVTRRDYEEKGAEYLKEHSCSNRYWVSPEPVVVAAADDK